jgi:hypothetical protein
MDPFSRPLHGLAREYWFWICTAKRLCNSAQGCRRGGYPGYKDLTIPNPNGVVGFEEPRSGDRGD